MNCVECEGLRPTCPKCGRTIFYDGPNETKPYCPFHGRMEPELRLSMNSKGYEIGEPDGERNDHKSDSPKAWDAL